MIRLNYRYQIYPPTSDRPVFRLIKLYKGTGKAETVKAAEIDDANDKFKSGKLTYESTRERLEKYRDLLYQLEGVVAQAGTPSPANLKLLDRLLALKQKSLAAQYEFERALSMIGKLSLETSTKLQLEKCLATYETKKRNRAVNKLNVLLRFVGRPFTLEHLQVSQSVSELHYISIDDLPRLLERLPIETRLIHQVSFYTGVTIGEAFALDARTYRPGSETIRVSSALDASGTKKDSKLKERTTVIIPEGASALVDWFQVRDKFNQDVRARIAKFTKRAAMNAWADKPTKHIVFQDLRHSYALHLLSKGVPMSLVANCLGIDESYARTIYPEFDLGHASVELVSKLLKAE